MVEDWSTARSVVVGVGAVVLVVALLAPAAAQAPEDCLRVETPASEDLDGDGTVGAAESTDGDDVYGSVEAAVDAAAGDCLRVPGTGGDSVYRTVGDTAPDRGADGESAGDGPGETAPADQPTITTTKTASLRPSDPGVIRLEYTAAVPDVVSNLTLDVGSGVTVVETDGFDRIGEGLYQWDESTERPTIVYDEAVNQSGRFGLEQADTGDWAFFDRYSLVPVIPSYSADGDVEFEFPDPGRVSDLGDEGVAGDRYVFIGNHSVREYPGDPGVRTVLPDAVSDPPNTTRVVNRLQFLDRRLDIGGRRDTVTMFLPPAPIRGGGEAAPTGGSFWVNGGTRVDSRTFNHEYVHTRQRFTTDFDSMDWLIEGSAEYYDRYGQYLAGGESGRDLALNLNVSGRYPDVVLTNRSTWEGSLADYNKGAHVLAALDIELREVSDGETTLADVLRRINERNATEPDERLNYTTFKRVVEAEAGESLDGWLDRYVAGSETPPLPRNMSVAYGDVDRRSMPDLSRQRFEVSTGEPFTLDAPGVLANPRPASADLSVLGLFQTAPDSMTLSANGSLRYVPSNAVSGRQYAYFLYVDGLGETDTETLVFDVQRAPYLGFTGVDGPERATRNGSVTVSATVNNTGAVSDTQRVALRLDVDGDGFGDADDVVATESVALDPNESRTVSVAVDTTGVPVGSYRYGVFTGNDSRIDTVVIQSDDGVADRFDDGDGEIQANEVLLVIEAYNEGDDLEVRTVLSVIAAFNDDAGWDGV